MSRKTRRLRKKLALQQALLFDMGQLVSDAQLKEVSYAHEIARLKREVDRWRPRVEAVVRRGEEAPYVQLAVRVSADTLRYAQSPKHILDWTIEGMRAQLEDALRKERML